MNAVLGIHIGHNASCAVVVDGQLVAAQQLERASRKKQHGLVSLSNDLPIAQVLAAANVGVQDLSRIVTSFQDTGPGGVGLRRRLVASDFNLFDARSERHWSISHHLAHAYSSFGGSGFQDAGVLICDYAGSTTRNGLDFAEPFVSWSDSLTCIPHAFDTKTESMSMYHGLADQLELRLLNREYCSGHAQQDCFVYSVAGLYENVSLYVMGKPVAHGQMMALAAYGAPFVGTRHDPGELIALDTEGRVVFRNDWQNRIAAKPTFEDRACLAFRCQQATELALLAYSDRLHRLTGSENLCVAGGVFLNILANSRLATESRFRRFCVPSAPHDAGIAVGCAFWGAAQQAASGAGRRVVAPVLTDRLGPVRTPAAVEDDLRRHSWFVRYRPHEPGEVPALLADGKIIARCAGRSEFGPRALGGRSLLAVATRSDIKDRMNRIKGRQAWRPVAPIVQYERAAEFFDGPIESFWMTHSQTIRPEHQPHLPALEHPDRSTRAQTLLRLQDPELYDWMSELAEKTGYPVVVNTSLNRGGEPIVETTAQALAMFLDRPAIDLLVADCWLVERRPAWEGVPLGSLRLAEEAILTTGFSGGREAYALSHGGRVFRLSVTAYHLFVRMGTAPVPLAEARAQLTADEDHNMYELLMLGTIQHVA
ncbi:MAG: carbamoyltransferase C-terminal domain-containing protein [Deltaproteobacteria bacterium]